MRHIKSERLKKLESELADLEQWLKLGLVPKKDTEKHKEEIRAIQNKIEEEKERLQFLRESGEMEDYVVPKRAAPRAGYTEMPTIPDVEIGETAAHIQDSQFEIESETNEGPSSASIIEEKEEGGGGTEEANNEEEQEDSDEESYFSDKNRWRRGGIVDPDADEW